MYAFCGQPAKATEFGQRALRLSPFDPAAWMAHLSFGHAAVYEDRYDDAVSHYENALHLSPQLGAMHTLHAIALALAGRADEARPVVTKALDVDPNFRIGHVLRMFKSPAFADKMRMGAQMAGLPV